MTTITIPKKFTKGDDLVVLPRKEYEELLALVEKKRTDRHLDEAMEQASLGKVIGPFSDPDELIKSLHS